MHMYLAFILIAPLTLINALPVEPEHSAFGGISKVFERSTIGDYIGDGASPSQIDPDHTEDERKWPELEWNAECEVKINS